MKTFGEFLTLKESNLDVDVSDPTDSNDESMLRAMKRACDDHPDDVMAFLQRLAKQNPDIQLQLDKMTHKSGNNMGRKKKLRLGGSEDAHGQGDVVIPNSADTASGELP